MFFLMAFKFLICFVISAFNFSIDLSSYLVAFSFPSILNFNIDIVLPSLADLPSTKIVFTLYVVISKMAERFGRFKLVIKLFQLFI